MTSSLSNLVDNLAEGIYKIKYKDCNCFLEYESINSNLIRYRFLSCNKYYLNNVDENLMKEDSGYVTHKWYHMSLITQESPYLKCCDVSNVNGWAMSQNAFKWTEDISVFYEFFIKSYNERSKDGYFLEVDIQYPENLRNTQNLHLIYIIKMNMNKRNIKRVTTEK